MAELTLGPVGAAATVGAATLATGSGFTGRHENSHQKEMLDTHRSTDDFMKNHESGEVTPDEEIVFLRIRDEAILREDEYHESIETSWFNPLNKIEKKKAVRRAKRATRQSNHSLRKLNEALHSGSDTSSICVSSGSPPGSNPAVDDLQYWIYHVHDEDADDLEGSNSSCPTEDEPGSSHSDSSSLEIAQRQSSAEAGGYDNGVRPSTSGIQPSHAVLNLSTISAANTEDANHTDAECLDSRPKSCQIQDHSFPPPSPCSLPPPPP
ncbi:hypothetical protein C8R44DRAFT_57671 [Mycena epipterygia]|nr:hypothetical protein C8R44DRAFT_57671 [Mycena epipterygia]